MTNKEQYALEMVKEIVIAKVGNSTIQIDKIGGEKVSEFLTEVYKTVLSIVNTNSETK